MHEADTVGVGKEKKFGELTIMYKTGKKGSEDVI